MSVVIITSNLKNRVDVLKNNTSSPTKRKKPKNAIDEDNGEKISNEELTITHPKNKFKTSTKDVVVASPRDTEGKNNIISKVCRLSSDVRQREALSGAHKCI